MKQRSCVVETLTDGSRLVQLAAGSRTWELEIQEEENWLHFQVRVAELAALSDERLCALLRANAGLGFCRLGVDEDWIVVRSDYPIALGLGPLPGFCRLFHRALTDTVNGLFPDWPGIETASSRSAMEEVERVADPAIGETDDPPWTPAKPLTKMVVDGFEHIEVVVDARTPPTVTLSWSSQPVPTGRDVLAYLLMAKSDLPHQGHAEFRRPRECPASLGSTVDDR